MRDPEMIQNRAGQAEIPAIGFIAQRPIRRDSIETLILQSIGLQLGHEAYAAAFLPFVDDQSATLFRDCFQSTIQLFSAIATQRPQHVAGQAFGMEANQWRIVR